MGLTRKEVAERAWQLLPRNCVYVGMSERFGVYFVRGRMRGKTVRYVVEPDGEGDFRLREVTRSEKNKIAAKAARALGVSVPRRKKKKRKKRKSNENNSTNQE